MCYNNIDIRVVLPGDIYAWHTICAPIAVGLTCSAYCPTDDVYSASEEGGPVGGEVGTIVGGSVGGPAGGSVGPSVCRGSPF